MNEVWPDQFKEFSTSEKAKRRIWMIVGEGSVFFLLLILGVYQIRKSLKKEVAFSEQQRNFLLSITHELKSPLASVKLYLQTLQKRTLEKEKQDELINKTLADNERLNSLVNNILLATNIESSSYQLYPEEVDFSTLTKEVVENIGNLRAKKTAVALDIQENCTLKADKNALISIVENLFENALKYTPETGNITIMLHHDEEKCTFEISDTGIGIDSEERQKVFEKFYRSGSEETRKSKGTGIGLYLVKNFVELHRGTITVEENPGGGSRFIVTLPKQS